MFNIEGIPVSDKTKPFVLAEVAQTHEGSLGQAMAFIEIAKECGADGIKFQSHIAVEESTTNEPWRIKFSCQDVSRFDYWRRMEFDFEQWRILKNHADSLDIKFLSSPFSLKACNWLKELGMRTWKVASGEIHNKQLIDWIISTGDPIIISTGLADYDYVTQIVEQVVNAGSPVAILHCTTQYPTKPHQIGLNVIDDFKKKFPGIPVGLSDHSGEVFPGVIASYIGANIIEVHLTMHKKMFGPDVSSSLTPEALSALTIGVRLAWEMRSNPVKKVDQMKSFARERSIFSRSLVANRKISIGEIITADMVGYKKPGGGLEYEHLAQLIGKITKNNIDLDRQIKLDDVR